MHYAIRPARFPADAQLVRMLLREYQQGIGIDLSFQDFESELALLPGAYAEPRGVVLYLEGDGEAAGCAALRPLGTGDADAGTDAEMKRVYVRAAHRGRGAGRILAIELIARAHAAGYARIYLDTIPGMESAQRLYASLGFRDVAAYRHNPIAGTRYMVLDLAPPVTR
jgi:putative acetyltransferase